MLRWALAPALWAVLLPSPRASAAVPADAAWRDLLGHHPALLGPAVRLRQRAAEQPVRYQEIRSQAGANLLAAGVVELVEGLPPERAAGYLQRADQLVARGASNLHQDTWLAVTEVALTWDLLHRHLAAGRRAAWLSWLNAHLASFTTDENAFHNSTLSKILCYLRVAYGTWGENPQAPAFRDAALRRLYEGKVAPVLRTFGAGGGYTECGWYARGALWHLAQGLELARRLEGYDGWQQAPRFFEERLAYELYQPYPGLWKAGYSSERYAVEGDGSPLYGGHNEYPRHLRGLLAQYYRGSELARAVDTRRRAGSNFEARLVDFLWDEGPDPQAAWPTDLPLAHLASGIGRVYARSDWTDQATWLRFECGPLFNHHQHFEVGNFELVQGEPLATESGEYHDYSSNHSVNWLLRTVAHNCLLVEQPAETWSRLRDGGRQPYANDGGQRKSWDWPADDLAGWLARRETFERGRLVAFHEQPALCYLAADCTAAYAPSKLRGWLRQLVFLRPSTVVIVDWVATTRPEYRQTWLLHSRHEPALAGSTATIVNQPGRLIVRTLLPRGATHRAVEGYTYGGATFDPPPTGLSPAANRWRLEVSPPGASSSTVYCHVLDTGPAAPATASSNDGTVLLQVGATRLVCRRDGSAQVALAGATHELPATVVPTRFGIGQAAADGPPATR
ncbi:MAG: heparinase II/III family protein [Fimbriimonadaceae bacterium]|nr:heparinase II/III family protein [Fimbriimonadaceae bacterium]